MIFFIIAQLILSWGAQSASIFGYCFDNNVQLKDSKKQIKDFILPTDEIFLRESLNCLEIKMQNSARSSLIEKVLERKYRIVRTYETSSEGIQTSSSGNSGQCHVTVEGVSGGESNETEAGIELSNNKLQPSLNSQRNRNHSTTQINLLLTSGRPGRISLDANELFVTCTKRANENFNLEFFLKVGGQSVSSSISVTKGQKLNIGSIAQGLDDRAHVLSTSSGIKYEKKFGSMKKNYYISVK